MPLREPLRAPKSKTQWFRSKRPVFYVLLHAASLLLYDLTWWTFDVEIREFSCA